MLNLPQVLRSLSISAFFDENIALRSSGCQLAVSPDTIVHLLCTVPSVSLASICCAKIEFLVSTVQTGVLQ